MIMPIVMPSGFTVRTVTLWYPADHPNIDDWSLAHAGPFDADLLPDRRLLALPAGRRSSTTGLAAPRTAQDAVRCAGGRVYRLDLPATAAQAARCAAGRHDDWRQTGTVRGRRPGLAEAALLHAGRDTYITYHRLRRVVGDAVACMPAGQWFYPAACAPETLVDYVYRATALLAESHPYDVLLAIRT
jgi:hypothetical protein